MKVIAFHLPQFHLIPENDQWWGEGFTEWTNVRKAKPLYRGHYQPRVPLENHYYNLLEPEVQEWQASLARAHGIHGFCYYHYWFGGQMLLEKPVEALLERRKPDLPFCLAWANEPWTRVWDGGEKHVLVPQDYSDAEVWRRHIQYLIRCFNDHRYIRVDGKPLFLVYRSASIRKLDAMLEVWHRELLAAGINGLHLVSMATWFDYDPRVHLFDAYAEFEPAWTLTRLPRRVIKNEERIQKRAVFLRKYFRHIIHAEQSYDYASVWRAMADRSLPANHYPGAFADWDNSPRRGLNGSIIMRNFDAEAFSRGMTAQVAKARKYGAEFLFFNAWNEWAEGTYLEPDKKRGYFFLESIHAALK